jgi:hypothetical protein
MAPTPTAIDQLVEAEQRWDALLVDWRENPTGAGAGARAGTEWSELAWSIAAEAGAYPLDPGDVGRGLELAARPVFLCGVHRSGTTLLRDLLDDHPAISVLPSEGGFYSGAHRHVAARKSPLALAAFGQEWLRRLANPVHQPPFWTLGRTTSAGSPYVGFARALLAWWPVLRDRFRRSSASWPLAVVAVAFAYSRAALRITPELRYWAEKTPGNERFRRRLRGDFPDARFVQVIRNPFATYASRRAMDTATFGHFKDELSAVRDMRRSYRAALAERGNDRYRVIRYEDLSASRADTTRGIADFLGVAPHPSLSVPTVAGLPATSNSSVAVPGAPEVELSHQERLAVAAAVGAEARRAGYDVPKAPPLRSRIKKLLER